MDVFSDTDNLKDKEEFDDSLKDNSIEIMEEVQRQMYKKARNYVGNNVLLVKGNLKMERAKDK